MTTKWAVTVSYQGYSQHLEDKIETVVGRMRDGSGFGFGWRDLDWLFDTEAEANAASERLAAVGFQSTVQSAETEQ